MNSTRNAQFPMKHMEKFVKFHIQQNFPFALQSRVNPHSNSHHPTKSDRVKSDIDAPSCSYNLPQGVVEEQKGDDSLFEMLPLTLQSEIGGHRIISLIKGNLKN